MAHVSDGPVGTLPGHIAELPIASMCDTHPDRISIIRIQGETDSFGAEYYDLCQECLTAHRAVAPPAGKCDWCKKPADRLRSGRDYDEGMAGAVYLVCTPCLDRQTQRLEEEMDQHWSGY